MKTDQLLGQGGRCAHHDRHNGAPDSGFALVLLVAYSNGAAPVSLLILRLGPHVLRDVHGHGAKEKGPDGI